MNPYKKIVFENLPRLLAQFDNDRSSESYGFGDRYYWAWGLIDFGNGTFQGAANGIARLWKFNLWPYKTSQVYFLERIDAIFEGTEKLTRIDGSLEEAFPYEGSYCVTALVAYDLISTIQLLEDEVPQEKIEKWKTIIAPLISYIIHTEETHAFISNHLATAVAALVRWHALTAEQAAETEAKKQLTRILNAQSDEGWFLEYEGADPGYQTLCLQFLADVHLLRADWNLINSLTKSINFLCHFAHPDGSFGGVYGSRCTRFYYPSGILALSKEIPEALSLAKFMEKSINGQNVVTLSTMDEPNFVPMFNSYVMAATLFENSENNKKSTPIQLPCQVRKPFRHYFEDAGVLIDAGKSFYNIISTHKGGVTYHYKNGSNRIIDCGNLISDPNNKLASTQFYNRENRVTFAGDTLEIECGFYAVPKELPNLSRFIILRLLILLVCKFSTPKKFLKKFLVKVLITKNKSWNLKCYRTIQLGVDLKIKDRINLPEGYRQLNKISYFVPIHMASKGYWQIQDEEKYSDSEN